MNKIHRTQKNKITCHHNIHKVISICTRFLYSVFITRVLFFKNFVIFLFQLTPRLEKATSAVREKNVSRHNESPIEGLPYTPQYNSVMMV